MTGYVEVHHAPTLMGEDDRAAIIWKGDLLMETQSIATYYEADHDRLDDLFKQFQASKRSDFVRAKHCFRQFKIGLQRHIVWEEEILFPFFEKETAMKGGGPTEVLRSEHRQIRDFLEAIHSKVLHQDQESDAEESGLLELLGSHNQKEQQILYPMIDRLLGNQERQDIFMRMKKVSGEELGSCCFGH
jgi:iron-sulfur cluster repair protein YtfE (RIC family)